MTDHDYSDDVQIMPHLNPVRGERSDVEVDVRIPDVDDAFERLVVRQVEETHFEVCCLPYTLYGLSLGDVVQIVELSLTSPGVVGQKVSSSGRSLYRVAVAGPDPVAMQSLASSLVSMGHLVEVWSSMMLAVDGADDEADVTLRSFLKQGHQAGQWQYEVAHIAG